MRGSSGSSRTGPGQNRGSGIRGRGRGRGSFRGRTAASKKTSTTTLPTTLRDEITRQTTHERTTIHSRKSAASTVDAAIAHDDDDARFKFRFKKDFMNRKAERKQQRLLKKQRHVTLRQQKSLPDPAAAMTAATASNGSVKKTASGGDKPKATDAAGKNSKTIQAQPAEKDKKREERQLRKLAETNPGFFQMLKDQNLIQSDISVKVGSGNNPDPLSLDADEANIEKYAKLLKLKKGKMTNKSFERDGLDFLLDGINGGGGADDDDGFDQEMQQSLKKRPKKTDNKAEAVKKDSADSNDDDDDSDQDDQDGEEEDDDEMSDKVFDSDDQDEADDLEGQYDSMDEDQSDAEMDIDFDEAESDSENSDADRQVGQDGDEDLDSEEDPGLDNAQDDVMDQQDQSKSHIEEKSADVSKPAAGKYVPPHLRNQPATKSEQYLRLKRQIQGLLNRLSDANLVSIVSGIEEAYRTNPRHDVTEIITDIMLSYVGSQANMLDSFIATYAGLIAALYSVAGVDFGAHFVQSLCEQFDASRTLFLKAQHEEKEETNKKCTNFATLLAMLYNFEVVSCVLIYDIVRISIEGLSELDVEVLLRILRLSGQQLRTDDPTALKDIILLVKASTDKLDKDAMSMRLKFMIETIMDLKNNKRKHNDQRVANQAQFERIKKAIGGTIKARSTYTREPLRVSMDDIRSIQTKGKWWLVGAAWAGHGAPGTVAAKAAAGSSTARKEDTSASHASVELLELARRNKMNTDIRRSIFVILMSSEDFLDAFERLLRLNLKDKQERDIVRVIVHCCTQEKMYNPYYALVAEQFCKHAHGFKITIQYAIWDALKAMDENSRGNDDDDDDDDLNGDAGYHGKNGLRRISNLARLVSHLFDTDALPLSVLKSSHKTKYYFFVSSSCPS
eukprot:jgi/Hompol1/6685/HPOL_002820-RA